MLTVKVLPGSKLYFHPNILMLRTQRFGSSTPGRLLSLANLGCLSSPDKNNRLSRQVLPLTLLVMWVIVPIILVVLSGNLLVFCVKSYQRWLLRLFWWIWLSDVLLHQKTLLRVKAAIYLNNGGINKRKESAQSVLSSSIICCLSELMKGSHPTLRKLNTKGSKL